MAGEGVTLKREAYTDTGTGAYPNPPASVTYPDPSLVAEQPPGSGASSHDASGASVVTEAPHNAEPTGAYPNPEPTFHSQHPFDGKAVGPAEVEDKAVAADEADDKAVSEEASPQLVQPKPAKKAPAARKRG